MQPFKEEKVEEHLKQLAAAFIQRESNYTSLITVTATKMADRLGRCTIYFTVLPEDKQDQVLDFLNRKRAEFKEYVKKHSRIGRLPSVQFALDFGEKNRQKIDLISYGEEARETKPGTEEESSTV
jgi:ribosome-binding factor A